MKVDMEVDLVVEEGLDVDAVVEEDLTEIQPTITSHLAMDFLEDTGSSKMEIRINLMKGVVVMVVLEVPSMVVAVVVATMKLWMGNTPRGMNITVVLDVGKSFGFFGSW